MLRVLFLVLYFFDPAICLPNDTYLRIAEEVIKNINRYSVDNHLTEEVAPAWDVDVANGSLIIQKGSSGDFSTIELHGKDQHFIITNASAKAYVCYFNISISFGQLERTSRYDWELGNLRGSGDAVIEHVGMVVRVTGHVDVSVNGTCRFTLDFFRTAPVAGRYNVLLISDRKDDVMITQNYEKEMNHLLNKNRLISETYRIYEWVQILGHFVNNYHKALESIVCGIIST